MAAGCIPIVSSIESFQHFVDSPRNGLLVDFARSEEAARRIAEFRTDCAGVAERARAVGESYSWKTRIPRWMELYEQVLAGVNVPSPDP
jgi:glycosyltransferase involved in cell wall biosynthesis